MAAGARTWGIWAVFEMAGEKKEPADSRKTRGGRGVSHMGNRGFIRDDGEV